MTHALIAATALSRGLPLFIANPADFERIRGLDVHAVRRASRSTYEAARQA